MSLIEVMIGMGIAVFASITVGAVMHQISTQEREAKIQIELDTDHAQLVQSLSRLDNLRVLFDLDQASGSGLKLCLSSKGSNCTSFSKAPTDFHTIAAPLASAKGQILGACAFPNSGCKIEQRATWAWTCPNAKECTSLEVFVASEITQVTKKFFKKREAFFKVPARSLVSRGKIAFDCTTTSMLFGIDYSRLEARCQSISGALASEYTMPMRTFASTVPLVTNNPEQLQCPGGISQLNLFGSKGSCSPVVVVGGPSNPTDTPTEKPVCDAQALQALSEMMIQRQSASPTAVAQNCIDSVNPTLEDNMPSAPFRTARFMNTCGNRMCRSKGFDSGRVIELNTTAELECRYSQPPSSFSNGCTELLIQSSGLMQHVPIATDKVAEECIDAAVTTFEENRNFTTTPQLYARFMQTCGKRACQKRNFKDGRVIESYNNDTTLECYNSPDEIFIPKSVSIDDVASNCIDSMNPTLQQNTPSGGNADRFQNTCGDRFCRNVLGFRSGRVVEYQGSTAEIVCVK